MSRTLALNETHVALGGRMVDFAGFSMPLQYTGILAEHKAVRRSAGLFDVSHMGEIFAMGEKAKEFVQHLITNDASRLSIGKAMYTLMCNEAGGVIDDLLVYKVNHGAYMLVVNASNIVKDFEWMQANNPMGADLYDVSDQMGLLALQGPDSLKIGAELLGESVHQLSSFNFLRPAAGEFMGFNKVIVSRTGYTGEVGLEFYVESENTRALWDAIMAAGSDYNLPPVGLGARDTLRLEAGFCLYGNELTEDINPYEAGLGWVTKLQKGAFVGREPLQEIKASGPERRLVGLVVDGRGIPRSGYTVVSESGEHIGHVTSGSQSPTLNRGIALAYVQNSPAFTTPGSKVGIRVRSRTLDASVRKLPFHRKPTR